MNAPSAPETTLRRLAVFLGIFSFAAVLAAHNISDGDLWAKLAIGAHVWHFGTVPDRDTFAFTPVLPHYIDHEWGAGTIFFGVLKFNTLSRTLRTFSDLALYALAEMPRA